MLCSPARYEKKTIPQEEINYIGAAIRSSENLPDRHSRVLLSAELFEYIVAHPTILSNPNFYQTTMKKIQEFENDTTVNAYAKLLSAMEKLKNM